MTNTESRLYLTRWPRRSLAAIGIGSGAMSLEAYLRNSIGESVLYAYAALATTISYFLICARAIHDDKKLKNSFLHQIT